MCNENYEVETDSLWDSFYRCMRVAAVSNSEDQEIEWIENVTRGAL